MREPLRAEARAGAIPLTAAPARAPQSRAGAIPGQREPLRAAPARAPQGCAGAIPGPHQPHTYGSEYWYTAGEPDHIEVKSSKVKLLTF